MRKRERREGEGREVGREGGDRESARRATNGTATACLEVHLSEFVVEPSEERVESRHSGVVPK